MNVCIVGLKIITVVIAPKTISNEKIGKVLVITYNVYIVRIKIISVLIATMNYSHKKIL